jgi:hypothetical protein
MKNTFLPDALGQNRVIVTQLTFRQNLFLFRSCAIILTRKVDDSVRDPTSILLLKPVRACATPRKSNCEKSL